MKHILITGGAGFIGHHFVEHFLKNSNCKISIIDSLNYSGNLDRLRNINAFDDTRVLTLTASFSQEIEQNIIKEIEDIEYILHLGAETHVDNSIVNPEPFVISNVLGTMHMLNFAKKLKNLKCFFYFGTDEVFGPASEGVFFKEEDTHNPKNPYAATKSAGEMLVKSYLNSYNLPCVITRTMNVFGERQHPEKFIPLVIKNLLQNKTTYIHADSTKTIPGSRSYIHARNVAQAYSFLIDNYKIGEEYHIVGEKEIDNLSLAKFIADYLNKPYNFELIDFHSSRPGHDLRYALSGKKMKNLGWKPPKTFFESLEKTINWFINNPKWL
jgi:dTDP-glucose 4,6-dehydratase